MFDHFILLMEEILHQLICGPCGLFRYLQGFVHPRWCRISSNSSCTSISDVHVGIGTDVTCTCSMLSGVQIHLYFFCSKVTPKTRMAHAKRTFHFPTAIVQGLCYLLLSRECGCRWHVASDENEWASCIPMFLYILVSEPTGSKSTQGLNLIPQEMKLTDAETHGEWIVHVDEPIPFMKGNMDWGPTQVFQIW